MLSFGIQEITMSTLHLSPPKLHRGLMLFGVAALLFGILWVGIEVLLLINTRMLASATPPSNGLFLFINVLLTVGVPTIAMVSGIGSILRYVWNARIAHRTEVEEEHVTSEVTPERAYPSQR
jgi:hypothetical protein